MSDMLGRSRPWDPRASCCARHGGPENMTPKRQREDRQWLHDAEDELADWRRYEWGSLTDE